MAVSKFYPSQGVKGGILLRQLSVFFAEILLAGRGAIDMKHIKQDFSLKAWGGLRGGGEAKIKVFRNIVMLHIK